MTRTLSFCTAIAVALFLGGLPASLHAQTDYSGRGASTRFTVGLGASAGIAVGTGSLDSNLEAAPGFAWRLGVNAKYPINKVVGVILNLGLDSRSVGVKVNQSPDARLYSARYFFIEPGISWSGFKLSMNIGLPLGVSEPTPAGGVDDTQDAPDDALGQLLEPRLGATLVLIDQKESWLGLTFDVGFPLTTFYDESYREKNAIPETTIPGTRVFNGHLGLTYQFAIPGT